MALTHTYKAIGLMSGTSLDGVDVAACEFEHNNSRWSFEIKFCHTYPYPAEWKKKLNDLPQAGAEQFSSAHSEYGHFLGKLCRNFMEDTGFRPLLIASHGHTIFHQPWRGFTTQIGAGSAIAAETGLPVVSDFRSNDIALGGQGAPLVPIGDRHLFYNYDACLNLGGFANISMESAGERIAWDICPVNIVLNRLASRLGLDYDRDGNIARSGVTDDALLEKLNNLEFYRLPNPKSLGREWLEKSFMPMLDACQSPLADILRTMCDHVALQVRQSLAHKQNAKIMATGGGANNAFLMELIRKNSDHQWTIPGKDIVEFKEALIFAFMGVLRWKGEVNVLRSVTGSRMDHCSGAITLISRA